jgi:hypothetical protein
MIRMKLKGFSSSRRALELLLKSTRAGAQREVKRACVATKAQARGYAPVAFGKLKDQIDYTITEDGLHGTVYSGAPYAQWVEGIWHNYEMGRGPGRWPPGGPKATYRPILQWLLVKGLVNPDTIANRNRMEFVVRRKIGQKGTDATPHLYPAYLREKHVFKKNLERIFHQAAVEAARIGGLLK